MSIYGMMDGYHGDEPEIEAEYHENCEAYDEAHADDWKGEPDMWGDLW